MLRSGDHTTLSKYGTQCKNGVGELEGEQLQPAFEITILKGSQFKVILIGQLRAPSPLHEKESKQEATKKMYFLGHQGNW